MDNGDGFWDQRVLAKGLLALAIFPVVGTLINGYVLSVLWSWFIVTTFNVPALSIPAALGLETIVKLLTIREPESGWGSKYSSDLNLKDLLKSLTGEAIAAPIILYAIGWFFHLFM